MWSMVLHSRSSTRFGVTGLCFIMMLMISMSPRIGAFTQSRGCKRLPFAVPNPIISNMRSSIIIREACTIGADRAVAICGVDSRALSCRSHFSTRTQPRRLPGAVLTVMAAKKSSEVEPPSKSKSKSKGKTTSVVEKSKVTAPAEPKPEAQARMPKAPETAKSVPPTPASDDVASATKDSASHASDAASMYVQVTEGSPIVKRKPASSGAAALRNGYNAVIKTLPVKDLDHGMKMRYLPGTDTLVTELGLGTMTFGEQTCKENALKMLDEAVYKFGINLIDTSEIYPMPYEEETYGKSEKIVGEWLKYFRARDKVVISTKVCGRSDHLTYCRGSSPTGTRVTRKQVFDAVDASLRRLGTDYIDVLHLNWPERYVPLFGYPKYEYDGEVSDATPIEEQIEIFADLIKAGKIRHYGLSNETPFGLASFLIHAKRLGLPRPVVVQNTYNLIGRNDFESGMVEACSPLHGGVGLLAAAPLAGGALTGKYMDDKYSESAKNEFRMRKHLGFMYPYITPGSEAAVKEYLQVAAEYDIPLNLMALSFVCSRPFVTSTLIGATNSAQLEENVLSLNIPMTRDIEKEFEAIYRRHVDPAKGEFEIVDPSVEHEDLAELPWGVRSEEVDPGLEALMDARMGQWDDEAGGAAGEDEEDFGGAVGEDATLGDIEGLPFGEAQVD